MNAPPVLAPRSRRHRGFAVAFAAACTLANSLPAMALTEVTGFGSNPGNLRMYKYVPPGLPANAPLVVALHGCAQSAASYDAETGWELLAQRWQFALLLPQQQSANNASSCFNWFENGDTARGQGETLSIKQMVDRMRSDHASAADRIRDVRCPWPDEEQADEREERGDDSREQAALGLTAAFGIEQIALGRDQIILRLCAVPGHLEGLSCANTRGRA